MLIDLTLPITPKLAEKARQSQDPSLVGHLGTHFDVMNKEFPLSYTRRRGVVFDVSSVKGRDIDCRDIAIETIEPDMFVAFYSGFTEENEYGSRAYFGDHPQLSEALIDCLLEKGVSIIGLDFAGARRGKEHTPTDQRCADRGTFILENLCQLKSLTAYPGSFLVYTYPMRFTGLTGLPCRVIAETE